MTEKDAQPKVFIGIATGSSKWYAAHYMVAALRNLDWENKEIHWGVTHFGNTSSDVYLTRLKNLMGTVEWTCPVSIHVTYVDLKRPPVNYRIVTEDGEKGEIASYDLVLKNLRKLRGVFLDGDCDLFLEVGGDNPPPRNTVQRLLALDADVAFGTCYQRPPRDADRNSYPLVWAYTWGLSDLDKYDLEPILKEKFKLAFTSTPFVVPIYALKDWQKMDKVEPYAGGTGMVLIKRAVLERVGWHLPPTGYFSEDLFFCHQCNAHGFRTVGDLKFHAPHFDESGVMF